MIRQAVNTAALVRGVLDLEQSLPLLIKVVFDFLHLLAILRMCIDLAPLECRLSLLEKVSARLEVSRRLIFLVSCAAEDEGLDLVVRRKAWRRVEP